MRLLFFLLIILVTSGAIAQPPPVSSNSANVAGPAHNELVARLDKRAAEVEHQNVLNEVRREIDNDANARLQNYVGLVSALIGVFALLTTVLLVIIAIRTPRQAISAAVQAASDALEKERSRINERVTEVERLLSEATALVDRIKGHETTAKSIIDHLRPGEPPESPGDRAIVEAAAAEASAKPPSQRSGTDSRAVFLDYVAKKDWAALAREAEELARAQNDNPREWAVAKFYHGLAKGNSDQPDEAIILYDQIMKRLWNNEDPEVERIAATAALNKAVELRKTGAVDEAIATYANLIERFRDRPKLQGVVASAFVNRGGRLIDQGKVEDALRDLDHVTSHYGDSDQPSVVKEVVRARLDKANALDRLKKSDESISVARPLLQELKDNEEFRAFLPAALQILARSHLRKGNRDEAKKYLQSSIEFRDSVDDPYAKRVLTKSYFDLAALTAEEGKVKETIGYLTEWRELAGGFDCNVVMNNPRLAKLLSRPSFKKFLEDQGCVLPVKAD